MAGARTLLFVSAICGATSGTVVAVLASKLTSERDTHVQATEITAQPNPSAVPALPRANRSRLGELEKRLDGVAETLEARLPVENGRHDRDEDADRLLDTDLDSELGRAADLAWWDEVLAAFENEESDPDWSARVAQTFDHDLEDLSDAEGYTTIGTECRSTRCRAVVEWPTYAEATAKFGALLHHDYRTNCARQTLLPEPSDEELEQPYQMTMVFDCSDTIDNG